MAAITVNGVCIEAAEGTSVLHTALASGIYIPHLCHHPDLTPSGQCRMCVVEREGRGLDASCQLRVEDGLSVQTESALVRRTRRTILESLLADYRGDCLACSKNRRCELQQVTAHVGVDRARLLPMRSTEPPQPLDDSNPFFLRDPNRCIVCGICVRTCDELQGLGAIDLAFNGTTTAIATSGSGRIADSTCESCGECVVRCPAGGLTDRAFERPTRETKTVCTYCGVGCSLYLGVRDGEVVSVRGDRESPVNAGRLCVKGRFGNAFIHSPDRLTTPLIRRNGSLVPASWDEALSLVADKFRQYQGDRFAGISSSRCTNEENYLFQKFVRVVMGTNNVDNCARLCHAPTVTGLTAAFGTGGGTNPLYDIQKARCILVIGSNATAAHAVAGAMLRRAAQDPQRATLILADPRRTGLADDAHLHMQLRPGTDVALLMGMARVILEEGLHDPAFIEARCEDFEAFAQAAAGFDLESVSEITGVPAKSIAEAARWYATQKPSLIVYSLGITEHTHGTDNVLALANLAMLTGNLGKPGAGVMPMRGQNNVQGACDMGCCPGLYPGYGAVKDPAARLRLGDEWGAPLPESPGLSVVEMFQQVQAGGVKALYIMGMDAAFSNADTHRTQEALRAAEFVVAQDIFLTGTAEFADVVLPAASFAEKEGTFTNLERRVQRVRKAIEPVGDSRPDQWIISEIARRMGAAGFDHADPSEVMDEVGRASSSFAGLSYARLEDQGIQWPCADADDPGTVRLHTDRFNTPTGKGRFAALTYRPPAESPDAEFPMVLTTGRSLYHFHLAMTRHVAGLMALHPEDLASIHPVDAARLGICEGDRVKVTSRRGELVVRATVTDSVRIGTAFMTFHFYETPTNVLTIQALDPAAKTPEFKVTAIRIEKV